MVQASAQAAAAQSSLPLRLRNTFLRRKLCNAFPENFRQGLLIRKILNQAAQAGPAPPVHFVRLHTDCFSVDAQPIRSSATEQAGSFTFSAPFSTVKSVKGCTLSSSLPKSLY